MHDEVHAALRARIAGLAMATGASVVAGTALVSHPRTHWEAWPDHGELFHTAWSFGPDGEPYDVIRQPRCHAKVLGDAGVDGNEELPVRVLHTPAVDVSPVWSPARPAASVAWIPQLSVEGEASLNLGEVLTSVSGARVAVRSALTGRMGQPLLGQAAVAVATGAGAVSVELASQPTGDVPVTWAATTVRLPTDRVQQEPPGAP
jgi:hypothetical protein